MIQLYKENVERTTEAEISRRHRLCSGTKTQVVMLFLN